MRVSLAIALAAGLVTGAVIAPVYGAGGLVTGVLVSAIAAVGLALGHRIARAPRSDRFACASRGWRRLRSA